MLSQADLESNQTSILIRTLVSDFKAYIGLVKVVSEILQNEGTFLDTKVSDGAVAELLQTLDMSGDEMLSVLDINEDYALHLDDTITN